MLHCTNKAQLYRSKQLSAVCTLGTVPLVFIHIQTSLIYVNLHKTVYILVLTSDIVKENINKDNSIVAVCICYGKSAKLCK